MIATKIRLDNIKKSREVVAELEARFLDGERFTVESLIKEFFEAGNYLGALQAKAKVKGWLTSLKNTFTRKHGLWFGNLNELNEYGLCQTEAEYIYVITRYYNFTKGLVGRAVQARNEASSKGLLTAGQEILRLPKIAEDRKR